MELSTITLILGWIDNIASNEDVVHDDMTHLQINYCICIKQVEFICRYGYIRIPNTGTKKCFYILYCCKVYKEYLKNI